MTVMSGDDCDDVTGAAEKSGVHPEILPLRQPQAAQAPAVAPRHFGILAAEMLRPFKWGGLVLGWFG